MSSIICPYCQQPAPLTDSIEVYGKSYGMIYLCKPCDAYVGVHKNSNRNAPLGTLANKELRQWRKKAHARFDPLWKAKMSFGHSKKESRRAAYQWLAGELGIAVEQCHIGMFDEEQCQSVIVLCTPYHGGK